MSGLCWKGNSTVEVKIVNSIQKVQNDKKPSAPLEPTQ